MECLTTEQFYHWNYGIDAGLLTATLILGIWLFFKRKAV